MPRNAIEKDNIKDKLKYIGLDLENIPEFIKNRTSINYKPSRGYDENKYNIYKFIDVRDIQILLTPTNRMDLLIDKYDKASPLNQYMISDDEENIVKHTMFLNMLKKVKLEEIKKVEEEQKELNKELPFKVRYSENYLWQIYYSEVSNQYFMLEPVIDSEYACFFYLLKKQIECFKKNKEYKIFVPICHLDYSGKYLKKSELSDIENYLWLFTKDWPTIYEVYDKDNKLTIQIVGETVVYEKVKSYYKIILNNKEEAMEFFKLLKALFILQTEVKGMYEFNCKINDEGGLDFFYKEIQITYDNLSKFVKTEYDYTKKNLEIALKDKAELDEYLNKLKEEATEKDLEYFSKEKEIATYLECKKTFFGKIKFFFKNKKKNKESGLSSKKGKRFKPEEIQEKKEKEETENKERIDVINKLLKENKKFYTIEDLVKLCGIYKEEITRNKNTTLDIKAMKNKIEIMTLKIKNAKIYIDEIDKHNKSIFDFWKFTNKDNALALNEGKEDEVAEVELEKTFDYEEDFEDLGKKVDKEQRKYLNKEECDSIFSTTTDAISAINLIKKYSGKKIPKTKLTQLDSILKSLQKEAEEEKEFFLKEDFDIFGGLTDDNTKIKSLDGKRHREIEKSKYKILDITKNTDIDQFKDTLETINTRLENAMNKSNSIIAMSLYLPSKNIPKGEYSLYNIVPENTINSLTKKSESIIRVNIKEDMPAIYLSNIIYFDNNNNTLPRGMEVEDLVLLDNERYKFELVNTTEFKVNKEIDGKMLVQSIEMNEYDLTLKEDTEDEIEEEENE